MNIVMTLIVALVVIVVHVWLCHRSPKFWYLGGIIPLLWVGTLVFLFFNGKLNFGEDWKMIIFPTLIFFLFWIQGYQAAKKKEISKMKAKDIQ
jgi:hypothetical protein